MSQIGSIPPPLSPPTSENSFWKNAGKVVFVLLGSALGGGSAVIFGRLGEDEPNAYLMRWVVVAGLLIVLCAAWWRKATGSRSASWAIVGFGSWAIPLGTLAFWACVSGFILSRPWAWPNLLLSLSSFWPLRNGLHVAWQGCWQKVLLWFLIWVMLLAVQVAVLICSPHYCLR